MVRDSTAQRELVKQGQSGYLMPYKSTEQEWSEALLSLIKNPQQRHEFSQQSLAHAKALFSRDIFKDKFEQALREANLL